MNINMQLDVGVEALIIGYRFSKHDVGKVVKLVRYLTKDSAWNDGFVDRDYWVVSGSDLMHYDDGCPVYGDEGIVQPKYLMPIRPEADPLEITQALEMNK